MTDLYGTFHGKPAQKSVDITQTNPSSPRRQTRITAYFRPVHSSLASQAQITNYYKPTHLKHSNPRTLTRPHLIASPSLMQAQDRYFHRPRRAFEKLVFSPTRSPWFSARTFRSSQPRSKPSSWSCMHGYTRLDAHIGTIEVL